MGFNPLFYCTIKYGGKDRKDERLETRDERGNVGKMGGKLEGETQLCVECPTDVEDDAFEVDAAPF